MFIGRDIKFQILCLPMLFVFFLVTVPSMQIHFFIKRNDIGAFVVNRCNVAVDKALADKPSGVFNFLPFLAAASEAKKLKTNQYLAIALATVIMYPTMVNAAAAGCYFKANSKFEKL